MNRDEGLFDLTHVYDDILVANISGNSIVATKSGNSVARKSCNTMIRSLPVPRGK